MNILRRLWTPPSKAPAPMERTPAERDVLAERLRQVSEEGYDAFHDDNHDQGELASAASAYAYRAAYPHWSTPVWWPWERRFWKMSSRRQMLVRAGALILAEIERIDRAAARD